MPLLAGLPCQAAEQTASTLISVRPPANFKVTYSKSASLNCYGGGGCFSCYGSGGGPTLVTVSTSYSASPTGSGTISCTPRQETGKVAKTTCTTKYGNTGSYQDCKTEWVDKTETIDNSVNYTPQMVLASFSLGGGTQQDCGGRFAARYGLSYNGQRTNLPASAPSQAEKEAVARGLQEALAKKYQGCTGVPSAAIENLQF